MCFTNNFFEKYLNAAQDEVLQSIEIIIQKMYSKLRGSASSSATLCIVSVIYLHWIWKIFYLPHIIFALLLLIFMSWGAKIWGFFLLYLDVRRKENNEISALTECGDLLGGGDCLTVAPVRVLVRHAHCRLQGVHITVSAMVSWVQGVWSHCRPVVYWAAPCRGEAGPVALAPAPRCHWPARSGHRGDNSHTHGGKCETWQWNERQEIKVDRKWWQTW